MLVPEAHPGAGLLGEPGPDAWALADTLPVEGHPQVGLDLELENVSDSAAPIEIPWGTLSSMLTLSLEDERAVAIPRDMVGGNEFTLPPGWLVLPVHSSMRIRISEYPGGRTMLRPFSFQAWDLPAKSAGVLYLRGTLTPIVSNEPGHRAWSGSIALPRI
jgi:hypothetical protein